MKNLIHTNKFLNRKEFCLFVEDENGWEVLHENRFTFKGKFLLKGKTPREDFRCDTLKGCAHRTGYPPLLQDWISEFDLEGGLLPDLDISLRLKSSKGMVGTGLNPCGEGFIPVMINSETPGFLVYRH